VTLLLFLIKAFIISFSGVMQPGPITAAAINLGMKNRFVGFTIALGHGIIELPLMILIILGLKQFLQLTLTQIIIGMAGGVVLLIMAVSMIKSVKTPTSSDDYKPLRNNPVFTGIILSASNPYFLIWWATIGLALATTAVEFGLWAFLLFAVVHWSVDCIWLLLLSWASHKGTQIFGAKLRKIVSLLCAFALIFFALFFLKDAFTKLIITAS